MAQQSTNARDADFLGEGTNASVQAAPVRPTTPDGLFYLDNGQPTPQYYAIQQANAQAQNTTRTANYGSGGTYKGAKQSLYGLSLDPATAGESRQLQQQAINARMARDGGVLGDLARLGTYYGTAGPLAEAFGAYSPDVVADIVSTPRSVVDELADQIIPGGSGAYGRNIVPGVQRTGGDQFYGSETIQSGSFRDGYRGVTDSGNTGIISGLIDAVPGYPFGDQVSRALGNIAGNFSPSGGGNVATYTPTMGTNGGSALTPVAQNVVNRAEDFYRQNTAQSAADRQQATTYQNRAAPQMALPSSANQQAVYDRAMNFQADTSGAQRLENMQFDMQGINNLESWSPQYSMQGVQNLESFNASNTLQGAANLEAYRPQATYDSANELRNWVATHTGEAADSLKAWRPDDQTMRDAQALREFRADRSGIDRLNAYADEPEGPSAAQAMLRSQADADKRTMLAMARSGRGGAAAQVAAQRNAMAEGSLMAAETRGQSAVLRAQETDAYQQRRLQALAQAGSLISAAEAQRLTAMAQAGQMMTAADQQKLAALQAYGELKSRQDQLQLSAKQSAGQLNLGADTNVLNAQSNAAQLRGQADSQILNARTNAAQLRSTMDAQGLSAISTAAGLRGQNDQIRSSNLQAAGNIRLQGSALNLNALSLAGQVASDIRNQDIGVLRSNLDAQLQTLGLNDNQVRFFNQMASDRDMASQNLVMQANALGINASQAQSALDLQWNQFAFNQLTTQQQMQLQRQQAQQANARANRQEAYGIVGSLVSGIGSLFGGGGGGGGGGAAPQAAAYQAPLPQVPNFSLTLPTWNNVGATPGGYQPGGMPSSLQQPIYQLTDPTANIPAYENQL